MNHYYMFRYENMKEDNYNSFDKLRVYEKSEFGDCQPQVSSFYFLLQHASLMDHAFHTLICLPTILQELLVNHLLSPPLKIRLFPNIYRPNQLELIQLYLLYSIDDPPRSFLIPFFI